MPEKIDGPWIGVWKGGKVQLSILLATPFYVNDEQYFLQLTLEKIPLINKKSDVFVSLIGGFDEPGIAYDHSKPTSFLMCLYPEQRNLKEMAAKFGTIDIA